MPGLGRLLVVARQQQAGRCRSGRTRSQAALGPLALPSNARPVPRNVLTPGAVCWARVEYADGSGAKVRPVVVLAANRFEVTVLPVTTRPGPARRRILDLAAAGLRSSGWIRGDQLTLDRTNLRSLTGHLSDADRLRLLPRTK